MSEEEPKTSEQNQSENPPQQEEPKNPEEIKTEKKSILDFIKPEVAQQLQEDVEYLTEEFAKVHDQMTEWAGAASGAAKDAIECILGKFECTMSNINGVVGPACKMVEEFKEKLDAKIQDKIRITKEQKADQTAMDAVPRKLKWRFYLTGYGYAIVSFVALFLI